VALREPSIRAGWIGTTAPVAGGAFGGGCEADRWRAAAVSTGMRRRAEGGGVVDAARIAA